MGAAAGFRRGRGTASGSRHNHASGTSLWVLAMCCCFHCASSAPPHYEPRIWNRSCNHTVMGVQANVFFNRTGGTDDVMFPISPGYRIPRQDAEKEVIAVVQRSCFGPGQRVNQTLVAAGLKMPCAYTIRPDGKVDYWEEAVCALSLHANCYCYSINAQQGGGYCIPGYKTAGSIHVDFSTASGDPCADARRKVQLDGGRPVTRQQVYAAKPPERGHFIAMVVWPNTDFHFFRRDAEGWWSQKRGDTFVTNTYPNGSVVLDVEDPAILGSYKLFCGYFHVNPDTHASTESTWTYSSIPQRLVAVQKQGYAVNSTSMQQPSTGWMRLNYPYLLFGLDAAVFESGTRRLPWQPTPPTQGDEAGQKGNQHAASITSSPSHWLSHAQVHTSTTQERDRATRAHYDSAARRLQGLFHA